MLLLSILLGFCIWFVGGWVLAGQVTPPPEAPVFSEDEDTTPFFDDVVPGAV